MEAIHNSHKNIRNLKIEIVAYLVQQVATKIQYPVKKLKKSEFWQQQHLDLGIFMNMGNQREVLKENIEKELSLKIEVAKDVLEQLNRNLEMSKQNSFKVKDEINITADLLREVLNHRRKELMKQAENLYLVQIRPLQEAMKSTYVTMGRLQSLLTNLDSFDQSQLVKLQIPTVDTSYAQSEPAHINAELDTLAVKDEISKWGNVNGDDDFQCCMMEDFEDNLNHALRTLSEKMTVSDLGASSTSNHQRTMSTATFSSPENKENQESFRKPGNLQAHPLNDWGIENWLKSRPRNNRMSLTSNEDNEEFLIVPPSCSYEDIEFMNNHDKSSDDAREDEESESSIMCIEKNCSNLQSKEDLSMWLKPKKTKSALSVTNISINQDAPKPACEGDKIVVSNIENVITALPLDKQAVSSGNADKRKCVLDFPCLNMEAESWIRKKKSRPGACAGVNKTVCPYILGEQKRLIPPTYALPNPFWLKKFQRR